MLLLMQALRNRPRRCQRQQQKQQYHRRQVLQCSLHLHSLHLPRRHRRPRHSLQRHLFRLHRQMTKPGQALQPHTLRRRQPRQRQRAVAATQQALRTRLPPGQRALAAAVVAAAAARADEVVPGVAGARVAIARALACGGPPATGKLRRRPARQRGRACPCRRLCP
jgi:hypothetical protein